MSDRGQWLMNLGAVPVDGLVSVAGYRRTGRPPEEVAMVEKAEEYGATAVFFEAGRDGRPPTAQAFIYVSDGPVRDPHFADLHRRLWSWGGVPLVYRVVCGLVQLFRCGHKAEFVSRGKIVFKPFQTLGLAGKVADDPWWDAERLRNGTLWDDPKVCKSLVSGTHAAQKTLIREVKLLYEDLNRKGILPKPLRRKLLILSLLVAYLEARKVLGPDYFARFRTGARRFFEVLADGPALVDLLGHLETRFNGHVFTLNDQDCMTLRDSHQLERFAQLIEGRREAGGQLTLWERYSFADLPAELISHIYQLFAKDTAVAVYTPHFLVRLMLGEVLSWECLDRLENENEVILDPCCGSGIFLVEAYKRLVLHWRSRHDWRRPRTADLQSLLYRVRGIDLEEGAVELAAFSLCLALCDALKPEEIRASVRLFPELKEKTIHTGCFFEACEQQKVNATVGVVVGNPPFSSSLGTVAAERAYGRYRAKHGALPDKQLAYLFLHESMELLAKGGSLSMLQQYNFLYNQQSVDFRRQFIGRWNVREILDFISVRGLFQKGGADTKVVVVVAEAVEPSPEKPILHATFRRSGRIEAGQGFDIDYYDLHWLPRRLALTNDHVWRSDLLGGGRVLQFVDRLKRFRTLGKYADELGWDYGEGFIEAAPPASGPVSKTVVRRPAEHLTGKPLLPSDGILSFGIDRGSLTTVSAKSFRSAYTKARYTPPMVLVHEQYDLNHDLWTEYYLTYKNQIVGFCGRADDTERLSRINDFLGGEANALRAYVAATSVKLFTQHATTLSGVDIVSLPYPPSRNLDLSSHEQVIVDDIVDYYRDLIRLGEDSCAMEQSGIHALRAYTAVYKQRINAIYRKNKLRSLEPQIWPGVICQPFVFGEGEVDWSGVDELKGKLDALLREQRGSGLIVTRIARMYDGPCIYLLKPDRLRYWLRSIALRDADETLADLWDQGF